MIKKLLLLLFLILLVMTIYNLSSLNLPSDQNRYRQFEGYCAETSQEFSLPMYQKNNMGTGMTSSNNTIRLLQDTQPAFDSLMAAIKNAQHNINIEFFIIRDDESGTQFKDLLLAKAKQGLEIRLLYDAWGSSKTPNSYFDELRQNGVMVAAFNPIWSGVWQGRLDNRLHRKMIIIDGKEAFIGGENIGDEYLGRNPRIGFWKDTEVNLTGDSVLSIQQIFLNDWWQTTHEKIESPDFYPAYRNPADKTVSILPGGPDSRATDMSLPYINLVNSAHQKIYMASPYFFPNNAFLKALYDAVGRNIEVSLVLPAKSDIILVRWLQPYYTRKLLNHGIKVYTYDQGFIHSKIMIIDDEAVSVGSANLDRLSFSRNYEITGIFYDKSLITELQNDFINDLNNSSPLAAPITSEIVTD